MRFRIRNKREQAEWVFESAMINDVRNQVGEGVRGVDYLDFSELANKRELTAIEEKAMDELLALLPSRDRSEIERLLGRGSP